jgi:hypothetical protein
VKTLDNPVVLNVNFFYVHVTSFSFRFVFLRAPPRSADERAEQIVASNNAQGQARPFAYEQ